MLQNRSLSPHLTVYKAENSSLHSIWHRITVIFSLFFLLSVPLLIKIVNWGYSSWFVYFYEFLFLNQVFIIPALFIPLFYHLLSGYRHMFWDTNSFLNTYSTILSSYLLVVIFLIGIMLNLQIIHEHEFF